MNHKPVLLQEAIDNLAIKADGKYIDATFGRGGHSQHLLQRLGPAGQLLAFDKDPEAIAVAQQVPFKDDARFQIVHASFAELEKVVKQQQWFAEVDGILMDLGVSSPQLDDPQRGFSFNKDGPLDMRMNPQQGMDASEWVNVAVAEDILRVLREYGEERFAKRIVHAVVEARAQQPIKTTKQLADIIAQAVPTREPGKHPATRSFQAIRIVVNRELDDLSDVLQQCVDVLKVTGRLCVISFHSLEDRMVKQFIQRQAKGDDLPADFPIKDADLHRRLKKIGGLIKPSQQEINGNPRARSSRLRVAEKI